MALVVVSRAVSPSGGSLTFLANFTLVGAQNPCPCGFFGDPEHACSCSPKLNQAASPVQPRSAATRSGSPAYCSIALTLDDERRTTADGGHRSPVSGRLSNADMGPTQVRDYCPVDETGRQLLGAAMQRLRPGR